MYVKIASVAIVSGSRHLIIASKPQANRKHLMLQVMDRTSQDNQDNVGDDRNKAGYTALGAPKHLYENITNRNTIQNCINFG